jgi:hypothetical protein
MKNVLVVLLSCLCIQLASGQSTWTPLNGPWYANDPRDISIATNGTMYTIGGPNRELRKSTNQGLSWTNIATPQANVYCVAVKPDNDQIVLIGLADSTVRKTTNGGSNWTTVLSKVELPARPNRITFNPRVTSVVFVGTAEGAMNTHHLHRSSNTGDGWSYQSDFSFETTITDIVFDPVNDDTIYVAGTSIGAGSYLEEGVWRTIDGGTNWALRSTGITNKEIAGIAIDPSNRATLYCCTYSGTWNIYKHTNYASPGSWVPVNPSNGTPVGRDIVAYSSTTLFCATTTGLWKTTDGGSWSSVSPTGLFENNCISMNRYTSGSTKLFLGTSAAFFSSTDAGVTWVDAMSGMAKLPTVSVAKIGSNLYAIAAPGYSSSLVNKSTNNGLSWATSMTNVIPGTSTVWEGRDVAANSTNLVVSGCKQGGTGPVICVSTDNGSTWPAERVYSPLLPPSVTGSANQVCLVPGSDNTIYVAGLNSSLSTTGRVFKSTDGGRGANYASLSVASGEAKTIVIDPGNTPVLYAGGVFGVYKTTNSGSSWSSASSGLPSNSTVNTLVLDPNSTQMLFAGTASTSLWETTNGGTNWVDATIYLLNSTDTIKSLFLHPLNSSCAYVTGTDGPNAFLYKNGNPDILAVAGQTGFWYSEQSGLPVVNKITVNPTDADTLYLASTDGVYSRTHQWEGFLKQNCEWTPTLDIQVGSPINPLGFNKLTVPAGKSLTITQGVKVRFMNSASMTIAGSITASGTSASVDSFKPVNDLESWGRITINGTATFKYCDFYKAETPIYFHATTTPGLVERCTFRDIGGYGIAYYEVEIDPLAIVAKKNRIIGTNTHAFAGIYIYESNVGIDSSYITGCRRGIWIEEGSPGFHADTIEANGDPSYASGPRIAGVSCYYDWPFHGNVPPEDSINPRFGGYFGAERGYNVIRHNGQYEVLADTADPFFGDGTSGGYNKIYDATDGVRIHAIGNSTVMAQKTYWGGNVFPLPSSYFETVGSASIDATNVLPATPSLISPANGATGVPRNTTFIWHKAEGAILYRLQVSTNSSFSTLVKDATGIVETTWTAATGLAASTLHYWRVQSKFQDVGQTPPTASLSDWSSVWSFTTGLTKSAIETPPADQSSKPQAYSLSQNYPNPFNPTTDLRYDLPEDAYVTLRVFDVLGKEVAILANEMQTAGYKSVTFDAGNVPSGIYFYRLQAGKFTETRKMMIVK